MAYRITEGYVYPSNGSSIGAVAVVFILVALLAVFYFTVILGGSLTDLLLRH